MHGENSHGNGQAKVNIAQDQREEASNNLEVGFKEGQVVHEIGGEEEVIHAAQIHIRAEDERPRKVLIAQHVSVEAKEVNGKEDLLQPECIIAGVERIEPIDDFKSDSRHVHHRL